MYIHLEKYMYFFPHYRQNAHLLVFRRHLYVYTIQVIIIIFIIAFQPRTLCRYFAVILESVTQRLHKSHFTVILQSKHHITKLSVLVRRWISWKCNTLYFYVHLWVLQKARKCREKVYFTETKSNFAHAPLMSLLGLHT